MNELVTNSIAAAGMGFVIGIGTALVVLGWWLGVIAICFGVFWLVVWLALDSRGQGGEVPWRRR